MAKKEDAYHRQQLSDEMGSVRLFKRNQAHFLQVSKFPLHARILTSPFHVHLTP